MNSPSTTTKGIKSLRNFETSIMSSDQLNTKEVIVEDSLQNLDGSSTSDITATPASSADTPPIADSAETALSNLATTYELATKLERTELFKSTFSYPTKRETTGEEVNFEKANRYPDTNLPEISCSNSEHWYHSCNRCWTDLSDGKIKWQCCKCKMRIWLNFPATAHQHSLFLDTAGVMECSSCIRFSECIRWDFTTTGNIFFVARCRAFHNNHVITYDHQTVYRSAANILSLEEERKAEQRRLDEIGSANPNNYPSTVCLWNGKNGEQYAIGNFENILAHVWDLGKPEQRRPDFPIGIVTGLKLEDVYPWYSSSKSLKCACGLLLTGERWEEVYPY